ncbi:MAG: leucyl/phenylalanyl-tRNA--protein transferase [Myxococcales bacterium]
MRVPAIISADDADSGFPDVRLALRRPNGLLAVGGNLSARRLMDAYREGVFPWYSREEPILWWCPDPRGVMVPERLHVSRSLRKTLRRGELRVVADTAFRPTVKACATVRREGHGTWIVPEMVDAYTRLHQRGHAHSIEVWSGEALVGGLYGVAVGRIFCGESMFSRVPDASKVAFMALCRQLVRWGFPLIDTQLPSEHLGTLGGESMPRAQFIELVHRWRDVPGPAGPWTLDADLLEGA